MPFTREQLAQKRDTKLRATMLELAPIWLSNETYRPQEDALLFDLVFASPVYGWISQHYKYDGFNDVLYRLGEHSVSESDALTFQDKEPYIAGEVATYVLNEPGNRPSPASPFTHR